MTVHSLIKLIHLNISDYGLNLNFPLSLPFKFGYIFKRAYGYLRSLYCSINFFTFQLPKIIIYYYHNIYYILPYQYHINISFFDDIVYQSNFDTYLKPLNVVYVHLS